MKPGDPARPRRVARKKKHKIIAEENDRPRHQTYQ
jgi:hypothetical protein